MAKLTDPDTKRAGLIALVASGMSAKLAYDSLQQQGIDIPERTLNDWKTRHSAELDALHDKYAPQLEQGMVRRTRDVALLAFDTAAQAVQLERERIQAGNVKDAAKTAQYLTTTGAIMTDKMLALTGRPSQITEHREPSQIIRSLAAKGIRVTAATELIEATAQPTNRPAERGSLPTVTQ